MQPFEKKFGAISKCFHVAPNMRTSMPQLVRPQQKNEIVYKGHGPAFKKADHDSKGRTFYYIVISIALKQSCFYRRFFPERCGMAMVDDGTGHIDRPPSLQASAQCQVDILIIGKEVFIKQADLIKHDFSVQCRTCAHAKNIFAAAELPIILQAIADGDCAYFKMLHGYASGIYAPGLIH